MLQQPGEEAAPRAIRRRSLAIAAAGTVFAPAILSLRSSPAKAQSQTAFDLISTARPVSTFAGIIKNHGLNEEFSAAGDYGFFVPLNGAIERVPALVVERFRRDKDYARQVILNHITDFTGMISNFAPQREASTDFQQVKTKAGYTLTLEMGSGSLPRLGGYPITYTNIRASNGYCHALDGVLLV